MPYVGHSEYQKALAERLGNAVAVSSLDGETAIKRLADAYQALQLQAQKIFGIYGFTDAPCNVRIAHNMSVAAYVKMADQVLAQLAQHGQVQQILFDINGNQKGVVSSATAQAPFVFDTKDCGYTTPLRGHMAGGQLGNPLIAAAVKIAIAVVIAGGAVLAVRQIVINWPSEAEQQVKAHAAALNLHLQCISDFQKQGLSVAQATERCNQTAPMPPPPRGGGGSGGGGGLLSTIGLVVVIAGLGAVAGYFVFRTYSPAEKERRKRIKDAEDEAKWLRDEAKRIRSEARKPRYAPVRRRYRRDDAEDGYGPTEFAPA